MTKADAIAMVEGMARGGDVLARLLCELLQIPIDPWDEEEPEAGDAP